ILPGGPERRVRTSDDVAFDHRNREAMPVAVSGTAASPSFRGPFLFGRPESRVQTSETAAAFLTGRACIIPGMENPS
ncbi:MAG: hypothetical protein LJE84_13360, partial [Gammaproteobacteria bacterium]|nr:hypothetical protein [Gammaproteobacteria bacterium]